MGKGKKAYKYVMLKRIKNKIQMTTTILFLYIKCVQLQNLHAVYVL